MLNKNTKINKRTVISRTQCFENVHNVIHVLVLGIRVFDGPGYPGPARPGPDGFRPGPARPDFRKKISGPGPARAREVSGPARPGPTVEVIFSGPARPEPEIWKYENMHLNRLYVFRENSLV